MAQARRQDDATIADRTRSSQFIRNTRAGCWNRAISDQGVNGPRGHQDITNSYTNVSALREQLHEAAETVAAFIARHAGCNPDAKLTRRLKFKLQLEFTGLIPIWPVRTRLAARRPNCYICCRLNALSRVIHGHTCFGCGRRSKSSE